MADIIEVAGLTKVFNNETVAVDQIDINVREGEIFGFLGPNGAGKTTTINILMTLLKPTEGHVSIAGYDVVRDAAKVREFVGLVPQELTVDEELTGYENIWLQSRLYHVPEEEAKNRIEELLRLVDLAEVKDRYVKTYSGGMRKRLELITGLVHRPKLLFLDEPTLGLDIQGRSVMWEYIKGLNRNQGMTMFLTTHYLEEADILCDRLAIIDRGKIIALGSPDKLKDSLEGDIVEIVVANHHPHAVESLRTLPHVVDVSIKDDTYRVKAHHGEKALPQILQYFIKGGVKIKSATLTKPTLDQVFLELTGRSLRDIEESDKSSKKRIDVLRRLRH